MARIVFKETVKGKPRLEIFKESKKSICHDCVHLENKCSPKVSMACGTDKKLGVAFVERCQQFKGSKS